MFSSFALRTGNGLFPFSIPLRPACAQREVRAFVGPRGRLPHQPEEAPGAAPRIGARGQPYEFVTSWPFAYGCLQEYELFDAPRGGDRSLLLQIDTPHPDATP